jgi:hypothetical protein
MLRFIESCKASSLRMVFCRGNYTAPPGGALNEYQPVATNDPLRGPPLNLDTGGKYYEAEIRHKRVISNHRNRAEHDDTGWKEFR